MNNDKERQNESRNEREKIFIFRRERKREERRERGRQTSLKYASQLVNASRLRSRMSGWEMRWR